MKGIFFRFLDKYLELKVTCFVLLLLENPYNTHFKVPL